MGEEPASSSHSAQLHFHDGVFAKYLEPAFPAWLRPNHITVFRLALVPFVAWLLLERNYAVGLPLFLFAGLTDIFDGSLARVRGQITNWGIVYDPVVDKLLIGAALVAALSTHVDARVAIVLLSLEGLMFIGNIVLRQLNIIRPANAAGKLKMVLEVAGIILLLTGAAIAHPGLMRAGGTLLVCAIIAAVVSIGVGFLYVRRPPAA